MFTAVVLMCISVPLLLVSSLSLSSSSFYVVIMCVLQLFASKKKYDSEMDRVKRELNEDNKRMETRM